MGSSVCIMCNVCVVYEPSPARSTIISTVSDGRAGGAIPTTSSAYLRGPSSRRDAVYQRHRSQEQYFRVRRQQRASTVNAPSVDRSVRRRPIFRAAIDVSMYSIFMEQAAAAGREEAFHGPPDYISRRAPSSLQQGRCGDACSPCAYGRTCAVPRVGLQSRALTLCLFLSVTRPRTGTRARARATWRCALAYW